MQFIAMQYIIDSFVKFKKDALSKVFYDILKYLVLSFVMVYILKYIPVIDENLKIKVLFSIWEILLGVLSIAILSFLLANILFRKKYRELLKKNETDELTGLKNYKALEVDLLRIEQEQKKEDEPISLILIDIDDFKKFNQENSYEIADKILAKLGDLLNKDSRITDETYRYFMRGDEFLIIAKQTSLANAKMASDRKRNLINDTTFSINGNDYRMTVCCGVTEFNKGEAKDNALSRVTNALQNAKKIPNKNTTEIIV